MENHVAFRFDDVAATRTCLWPATLGMQAVELRKFCYGSFCIMPGMVLAKSL
jgi:hypothetical protein